MKLTSFMKDIGFDDTKISNIQKYSNNFDLKMPLLVINCDIHKDRMNKFDKSAQKIGLDYYRLKCVYGKNFTDKQIYTMYKKNLIKKTDFINMIEVSINLSHINAWLKILNSNYDYGMVCEDDITFKPKFKKYVNLMLNELQENNKNFDILYLWNGNWMNTKSALKLVHKINKDLVIKKEMKPFNAGNVSYIISKKAIKLLLKKILPIGNPVDLFMGKFYNQLKIYTLYMKYDKVNMKDISPLFVSGEWDDKYYVDSDTQSTQDYDTDNLKYIIANYN